MTVPPASPPAPIAVSIPTAPGAPPASLSSSLQAVVQPMDVVTPSGQKLQVLGQLEFDFYTAQAKRYTDENEFTNISDLLDLDRLLFYELIIYRMTCWLGTGTDYDNMTVDRVSLQRNLKETSDQLSKVKNDLGLTKSARDKAQAESVGQYLVELKRRAMEFGVHREKQLVKGITLCKQLFSIVGAFDRADEVERRKLGFETEADVLAWIRETMKPEFDAVDDYFRTHQQKYWLRDV